VRCSTCSTLEATFSSIIISNFLFTISCDQPGTPATFVYSLTTREGPKGPNEEEAHRNA
jgi:hypothetical protein